MTTTFTSRDFNQDASGAKRAAEEGPVIITDRGRPAHVLMTIAEYRRLTATDTPLSQRLAWPGAGDVDLPLDRSRDPGRVADFD